MRRPIVALHSSDDDDDDDDDVIEFAQEAAKKDGKTDPVIWDSRTFAVPDSCNHTSDGTRGIPTVLLQQ